MAKRKTARKPQAKIRAKLDTQFTCVFCNHEKSIECKLDRLHNIGSLQCRVCGVEWQTRINHLSEPVDVFSDWIDACEEENKKQATKRVLETLAEESSFTSGRADYQPRSTIPTAVENTDRISAAISRSQQKTPKNAATAAAAAAQNEDENEESEDDSFIEPDDDASNEDEADTESEEEEEEEEELSGAETSESEPSEEQAHPAAEKPTPTQAPPVKRAKLIIDDDDDDDGLI